MKAFLKKNWELIFLVSILCFGIYLRLYKISDYMTFLGDEGRDVLVVKRMIVDHKFTLLGPTASVGGFFLGPIYYYFMLPFLWLWRLDPTGPAVMVALFGIATIYLVYRVGREFFNPLVGIIAASLYTVSPLVVAYSRSSWNPNLVPFFSTLFIYLLWRTVVLKRWTNLFWVGVIAGIGLQLHYLFLFLFPVAILWFLLYGKGKKLWRFYILGVIGFGIGYAPFLAFEMRHDFPNTQSIIRFIFSGKETGLVTSNFMVKVDDLIYRLFARLVFRSPQPEIWSKFNQWQLGLWFGGTRAVIVSSAMLMLWSLWRGSQTLLKQRQSIVLLLLWLVVPVGLFGFYRKAIYDYYLGISFALPFVITSVWLFYLSRLRWAKWLAVLLWAGLLLLNWQGRPFVYPPNRQLNQAKTIAAEALAKTEGRPFNFALVADFNSDHAYRYFFEIWGNKPVAIENEINDPARSTVTDQLIVICEKSDCAPLGHPLWEIAGFGRAQIAGVWEVSFVKIFKLIPYSSETGEL